MKHLFGTDGIRGVAGKAPLTPRDVYQIAFSAGLVLKSNVRSKSPKILVVRDTRESGIWISEKLSEGFQKAGVDVVNAGVLSTPSVAYLVKHHGYQAGAVISASHNPPEFNGIKFFTPQGRKWPDAWEKAVEKKFYSDSPPKLKAVQVGLLIHSTALHDEYERFLMGTLKDSGDFSGFRIALDCSNGANSATASEVFRRLGAEVFEMGVHPNGSNINVGCGSQHTEKLARLVVKKKCHLGIAYDGDGDRVILVDEKGKVLDGDHIIALLAKSFKQKKRLKNNVVVITVMANLGLKKVLKEMGVRAIEVSVGDRYVSEAMQRNGSVLGGEQSGHIILGEFLPTGDGLLTSLHMLAYLKVAKQPLSKLGSWLKKYPQTLLNVPVQQKTPLEELSEVPNIISAIEKKLGDDGRVLVRYSGTEPLLRIMIEAPDKKKCDLYAQQIAEAVKSTNGASRR